MKTAIWKSRHFISAVSHKIITIRPNGLNLMRDFVCSWILCDGLCLTGRSTWLYKVKPYKIRSSKTMHLTIIGKSWKTHPECPKLQFTGSDRTCIIWKLELWIHFSAFWFLDPLTLDSSLSRWPVQGSTHRLVRASLGACWCHIFRFLLVLVRCGPSFSKIVRLWSVDPWICLVVDPKGALILLFKE